MWYNKITLSNSKKDFIETQLKGIRYFAQRGVFVLKIAVVDDDIQMYERLQNYFDELLGAAAELIYFPNGETFLDSWQPGMFDLIILDIFMDRLTGMDIAKNIRRTDREVRIVFCTTSNEFASESYEVNACYYLHKPFGKERVKAMLDRIDISEIEKMRTVRLPDGTNAVLRDIIYVDCSSHCITLHCKCTNNISVRANFSQIESLLCAYPYFFIPSKGLIVNFYEVTAQNHDTFTMSDGSRIPISRRKAKEVMDAYSAFLFEQLRKGGEI